MLASSPALDAQMEARARKIQTRIIPFVLALFVIAFIDRINIGFAALTLVLSARPLCFAQQLDAAAPHGTKSGKKPKHKIHSEQSEQRQPQPPRQEQKNTDHGQGDGEPLPN